MNRRRLSECHQPRLKKPFEQGDVALLQLDVEGFTRGHGENDSSVSRCRGGVERLQLIFKVVSTSRSAPYGDGESVAGVARSCASGCSYSIPKPLGSGFGLLF